MSSNVCGNCANFKPGKGAKFFNCTFAQQGGATYAMQVRLDTRSCEAFVSLKPSPKPQAAVKPAAPPPKRAEPRRGVLCNWGRAIMVAALIIIILLIAFGAYTCFRGGSPTVTPTPTPQRTEPPPPPPTLIKTPTPAPTPVPVQRYSVDSWVRTSQILLTVTSPENVEKYWSPAPNSAPAGTRYVFITVTVTNISSGTVAVAATQFSIIDSMGTTYRCNILENSFYNAFPYFGTSLGLGQTMSGKIRFTVPKISTGLEVYTVQDGYTIAWTTGL